MKRNIERFPSKQMYPYLSLVERKVAEFYHDIDRRSWLVWVKMTYFHRFFRTIPGVLAGVIVFLLKKPSVHCSNAHAAKINLDLRLPQSTRPRSWSWLSEHYFPASFLFLSHLYLWERYLILLAKMWWRLINILQKTKVCNKKGPRWMLVATKKRN